MKVNWWKNDFGKIEITEAESSDDNFYLQDRWTLFKTEEIELARKTVRVTKKAKRGFPDPRTAVLDEKFPDNATNIKISWDEEQWKKLKNGLIVVKDAGINDMFYSAYAGVDESDEVIGKYFLEAELDLPEVKTVSATVERVSPVNEREKK